MSACPTYEDVNVGDELPPWTFQLERANLVRYAGASGDFNEIHWSESAAQRAKLPDVIAHGMLTMGQTIVGVSTWLGDPGAILEYGVRFVHPVVVADGAPTTVHVMARVVEKLGNRRVRLELTASCGGLAVLGLVEVLAVLV